MKKRKIAVVTGTRAEYGLLYWTMKEIIKSGMLELQLIVTGMHLSEAFGGTYKQIEQDGFVISKKVDIHINGDEPKDICSSMGTGIIGFSQAFEELNPDFLLVLGDRYEILAAVSAALVYRIPVAHISGGEITEGAVDEQIRHAITKMAHIHFPGAKIYADNIICMGEEKWRVFNVGDPGIENIKKTEFIGRKELFSTLGINIDKKTFLVTLHPTTLNSKSREEAECRIFFDTITEYDDVNIIITYPNSDANSAIIIDRIRNLKKDNIRVFESLGSRVYLSLMKESNVVIGNSSSALIEAPFLKIPAIDYGHRQKGRLKAENIIHVEADVGELRNAINKALFDEVFLGKVKGTHSLYGEGDTGMEIVKVLESIAMDESLVRKKFVPKR